LGCAQEIPVEGRDFGILNSGCWNYISGHDAKFNKTAVYTSFLHFTFCWVMSNVEKHCHGDLAPPGPVLLSNGYLDKSIKTMTSWAEEEEKKPHRAINV
jgi:hypothetical protein